MSVSKIEISKDALLHNLNQFKKQLKSTSKVVAVVKANAYGHGLEQVVKILDQQVKYFQVDDIEELTILRKYSKNPALVLGYLDSEGMQKAIDLKSEVALFHSEQINSIQKPVKVHLAVDCLLGREGITLDNLPKLLELIQKNQNIDVKGIYGHFANIEDTSDFTQADKQIKVFLQAVEIAETKLQKKLTKHISATSGIMVYEEIGKNDLVRLGIGLYGLWPSEDLRERYIHKYDLKQVMTWKTKIAQIKELPAGYPIGYGLTFITDKSTKVGLIPQGYSDGLDRGLSNVGKVLVNGNYCHILGRVAMNMTVIDLSEVKNVNIGDEVVILGRQNDQEISAEKMATQINTINYEVIARISSTVPRVII